MVLSLARAQLSVPLRRGGYASCAPAATTGGGSGSSGQDGAGADAVASDIADAGAGSSDAAAAAAESIAVNNTVAMVSMAAAASQDNVGHDDGNKDQNRQNENMDGQMKDMPHISSNPLTTAAPQGAVVDDSEKYAGTFPPSSAASEEPKMTTKEMETTTSVTDHAASENSGANDVAGANPDPNTTAATAAFEARESKSSPSVAALITTLIAACRVLEDMSPICFLSTLSINDGYSWQGCGRLSKEVTPSSPQ